MSFAGKKYWIIGASEGLGRALALKMSELGAELVLSARSEARLHEIKAGDALLLPMDVTDEASVDSAIETLPEIHGVIYCAGAYDPMTAQEWDQESALRMMDVNLLGAMRVLPPVIETMLEQNRGHIALIGSLASYYGLPGAIAYGASKAGLMHLAENLYVDLKKTDIKVQIINPGFIKTRLTQKNSFEMPQLMTPEEAADHVVKALNSRRFRTAFPRPFAWAFRVMRLLPDAWVRRIL